MGLPIWREPPPKTIKKEKFEQLKAAERVSEAHDRASRVGSRRRREWAPFDETLLRVQSRQRTLYPPLLEPVETSGRDDGAAARSGTDDRVPFVPVLLESANTGSPATRSQRDPPRRVQRRVHQSRSRRAMREHRHRLNMESRASFATLEDVPAMIPHGAEFVPPTLRRAQSIAELVPLDEPTSRVDGLGDRNRSPTPAEAWEVIRTTIQPDEMLPSAESSFTSALASQSFSAGNSSTNATTPVTTGTSQQNTSDSEDDSASSMDLAEICADEENEGQLDTSDQLARDMYYSEMETLEGRERIAEQQLIRSREGNRFALADEAAIVDIGFRLIEAALERVEDRHRTLRLRGQATRNADYGPELTRLSNAIDVHRARQRSSRTEAMQEVSTDAPIAHPVSMPDGPQSRAPTEDEVLARLNPGEELEPMRHIIEQLASREDVPDEWWTSMGLNLLRPRPRRSRDATQGAVRDSRTEADLSRVRSGRIERPTRDDVRDRSWRL